MAYLVLVLWRQNLNHLFSVVITESLSSMIVQQLFSGDQSTHILIKSHVNSEHVIKRHDSAPLYEEGNQWAKKKRKRKAVCN